MFASFIRIIILIYIVMNILEIRNIHIYNLNASLKIMKDKNADIETNKLVIISEFLSPIKRPKKPDNMAPIKGKNTKVYSILSF